MGIVHVRWWWLGPENWINWTDVVWMRDRKEGSWESQVVFEIWNMGIVTSLGCVSWGQFYTYWDCIHQGSVAGSRLLSSFLAGRHLSQGIKWLTELSEGWANRIQVELSGATSNAAPGNWATMVAAVSSTVLQSGSCPLYSHNTAVSNRKPPQ